MQTVAAVAAVAGGSKTYKETAMQAKRQAGPSNGCS